MKVSQAAMEALSAAQVDGSRLTLVGQLDRKLYQEVAQVLLTVGGKWVRGSKSQPGAHVFPGDAGDAIEPILLTGETVRPQDFGFFETQGAALDLLMYAAGDVTGKRILEPSAGCGRIVNAALAGGAAFVFAIELQARLHEQMMAHRCATPDRLRSLCGDFMDQAPATVPGPFDLVLMNPPFALPGNRSADQTHVMHAWRFLEPGGRLVAIMSASVLFRQDNRTNLFRAWVGAVDGQVQTMPEGSFKASGTNVRTIILTMEKPHAS